MRHQSWGLFFSPALAKSLAWRWASERLLTDRQTVRQIVVVVDVDDDRERRRRSVQHHHDLVKSSGIWQKNSLTHSLTDWLTGWLVVRKEVLFLKRLECLFIYILITTKAQSPPEAFSAIVVVVSGTRMPACMPSSTHAGKQAGGREM